MCPCVKRSGKLADGEREKALGTLESYEQKNIDAFESSLEDAKERTNRCSRASSLLWTT